MSKKRGSYHYDELSKLNYEEQQKIIRQYHKINSKKENETVHVMIDSGEHSMFITVKKDEEVIIDGVHSKTGITPEEEMNLVDDKLDDLIYNKPNNVSKRILRRIKKRI